MRKKLGTVIDEEVLRQAKVAAAAEGVTLSALLESALKEHLERRPQAASESVVASTRGVMAADLSLLRAIMEEESALDV